MARTKKSLADRQHGVRATYLAGCRCDKCAEAHREYSREYYRRTKAKPGVERPVVDVVDRPMPLREIRIPVSCPNCGGDVVQQTPSAVTGSGMRVTVMLRCSKNGCKRQWQFVGVLMSLNGAEYMGAA